MVAFSLAEATRAACGGSAMTLGEGVHLTPYGCIGPYEHKWEIDYSVNPAAASVCTICGAVQPTALPLQVSEWQAPKGNGWTGSNETKPPPPIPRLARTVRVGAITFTVRRTDRLVTDGNLGETRTTDGEILLRTVQNPETTAITFLHEILHTISYDRHLGDALTEPVVDSLANGLAAVLQDLGWMPKRLLLAEDP